MKISPTKYYLDASKFFRSGAASAYTDFCEDGFSFVGCGVAVCLKRLSDSNYKITAISGGEIKIEMKHSIPDAVRLCEEIVKAYL